MRISRSGALLWFGLLGAPVAWAAQHIGGIELSLARCGPPGSAVNLDLWTLLTTATTLAIATAAAAAAIVSLRATRDAGSEPPGARMHFLSIIAVSITPLFLLMMLMSGIGALFATGCRQS